MPLRTQKSLSVLLFALIVIATATSAAASVLTFDTGVGFREHGFLMPQDYGDRIVAGGQCAGESAYRYGEGTGFTPNVALSYAAAHGSAPDTAVTAFFDAEWIQVACLLSASAAASTQGGGPADRHFDFTFTPDQGFGVRVNSFVLDDYDGFAGGHDVDWAIYADFVAPGNVLVSGNVMLAADEERLIQTGMTDFHGRTAILRITHVAGDGTDLALDDVDFEQLSLVGVGDRVVDLSGRPVLHQARPNPFSRRTSIRFDLPVGGATGLAVFDANGRQVRSLVRATLSAGVHTVEWDGNTNGGGPAAPGVFFYRLDAGDQVAMRKFVLFR